LPVSRSSSDINKRLRTHFKGAHEILQRQTCTKPTNTELDEMMQVRIYEDGPVKSPTPSNVRAPDHIKTERVAQFTREVLKACNVIRPSVVMLT
jgi:hypothetical protein